MNKQQAFIADVVLNFTGQECLAWPFEKNWKGYGRFRIGRSRIGAHRVICTMAHGSPPSNAHVAAHSCGKGHMGCVNPTHIRWATAKENHADKAVHGTIARGEKNGNAKLTEAIAREILALKGTMSQNAIASHLGVTRSAVRDIHVGKAWAWLGVE